MNSEENERATRAIKRGSLFEVDVLKGVFGAQSEYDW